MKKRLLLFLCVALQLAPASGGAKERYQQNKEYFARKKKVKKAEPTKIGVSKKKNQKKISEDEPLTLLDESKAVISTVSPEKVQVLTTVVTMQDVNRQGFDGGKYSVEDLIDFSLMDHLSKDFKINVTNDDINRHCQKMNLSKDQLKYISEANWFPSLDAFYELFKKNYRGRMALNFLVDSQIVVSEDEIKNYWQNNPVWLEPVYFVEVATVPLNGKSLEAVQKEIAEKEKRNNLADLEWSDVTKILDSEIGESNNFLSDLKVGDVYLKPEAAEITLYRLKRKDPKRQQPLEERKKEITNRLKMEKSFAVEEVEKKGLRKHALISTSQNSAPDSTKELIQGS